MKPANVLDLTRQLGREPDVMVACNIMTWELGDLTKMVTYMKWHDDEDLRKGWGAEASLAIASLLFQLRVVTELLEYDFDELLDLGVEIVEERKVEKDKKTGRHAYYVGDEKSG